MARIYFILARRSALILVRFVFFFFLVSFILYIPYMLYSSICSLALPFSLRLRCRSLSEKEKRRTQRKREGAKERDATGERVYRGMESIETRAGAHSRTRTHTHTYIYTHGAAQSQHAEGRVMQMSCKSVLRSPSLCSPTRAHSLLSFSLPVASLSLSLHPSQHVHTDTIDTHRDRERTHPHVESVYSATMATTTTASAIEAS